MVIGFFMILVDTTIVSVATPAIMTDLDADVDTVIWVTSAYLLAYAVPLAVTGRLGDRLGPKWVYLSGLAVFTAASAWCGLTSSVEMLIVARAVQGLGASLVTPQTMAVITRTFPADSRGRAMALWGATAGVAILVGPLLGGVLVDGVGWQWIFFVNVPVGLVALVLGWRLVPRLPTHSHDFDLVGVALSGVGMFLLVFGIQEGQSYDWDRTVWLMIGGGVVVLAAFVGWQALDRAEPLVPLSLFADRNFTLSNLGVAAVGFAVTSMGFPVMLYAQVVRGWSPTESALLLVPVAVFAGGLAPLVGRLADTRHPRYVVGFGMAAMTTALFWLSRTLTPDASWPALLLPMSLLGVANAFVWPPLGSTATRNLPLQHAGAGAGVYNTTRQVGSVLGSASIAALMQARLTADLGAEATSRPGSGLETVGALPAALHEGFAAAMAESLLLPSAVLLLGLVAAMFYQTPRHLTPAPTPVAGAGVQRSPA
jgi:EmrB/QacA subfamily drug resistance transporter